MGALHDVVRAGKARYIGASSMFAWQFAKAQHSAEAHGWTKFASHAEPLQPDLPRGGARDGPPVPGPGRRLHPLEPPRTGRPGGTRTRDGGRHTTRSSTDPFTDYLYDQPTDFDVVDAVAEVAAARGVPSAEVALAWLLAKPGVTAPIVGATKKRHLKDALAAEEFTLSEDEIARLEKPYVPHPVLGHF